MTIRYIVIILGTILLVSTFLILIKLSESNSQENSIQKVDKNPNIESDTNIRSPAVAGSFYPSDPKKLDSDLTSLLDKSTEITISGKPRILIVPHAGISYSGEVAASGFKQLEGMNNLRVIILGASHTNQYNYSAVDNSDYWQTPQGKVEVDNDFVATLVNGVSIRADKNPHVKEHSLEMEIIFLQKVLKNFKIVPILLGQTSDELQNALAHKLAYNFDDNTILIISTDLSHYPNWKDANTSDNLLVDSILLNNVDLFEQTLADITARKFPNEITAACGQDAIKVALKMAGILGIINFQKIKYENSGDVTGDKSRVVGYASLIGVSESIMYSSPAFNKNIQKEALEIARNTLDSYLSTGKIPDIKSQSTVLQEPLGVFTTLTKNGLLRGCIGEFEPTKPLYKVIKSTTVSSATEDKRFLPVTTDELKDIKIEISVMTPRRKVTDWKNIKLGTEGVVIQRGVSGGTFLPQVASDNNWDLEKFLSELCSQKAGLEKNCYKDPTANIYSFEVTNFAEE
jgi:MEMO1 family protein